MAKLKALRGAVGSYGRVAAGGIVDVDNSQAEKLLKSGRFVLASDVDIASAQAAQKKALAVSTLGAGAAFLPMPAQPETADRLSQMVASGQLSRDKARELVSLQISLSTEEVQAYIKAEGDRLFGEVAEAQAEIERRQAEIDQASEALATATAQHDARETELASREAAVIAREAALADAEKALEATTAAPASKASEKAGK